MNRVLLLALTLVVLLIAAFAAFTLIPASDLRTRAEAILVDLAAGRVAEVHAAASEAFRAREALGQLEQNVALHRQVLGAFEGVERTLATETAEDGTRRIELELRYARALTKGSFVFVEEEGATRLFSFLVELPRSLLGRPDLERLEAKVKALLDLLRREAYDELYAAFAPTLRTEWPRHDFDRDMRTLGERRGRVLDISYEGRTDDEGGPVVARGRVTFERGTAEVRLRLAWTFEGWEVLGFAVDDRDGGG